MSMNDDVKGVRFVLDRVAGQLPGLNVAKQHLQAVSGHLTRFLEHNEFRPDLLSLRIGALANALVPLSQAIHSNGLADPPDPNPGNQFTQRHVTQAGWAQFAWGVLTPFIKDLNEINQFYMKNSSRCDKVALTSGKIPAFIKQGDTYQWSKPLRSDDLTRRNRNLMEKELGTAYAKYFDWLLDQGQQFREGKSTAWLATVFLLRHSLARSPQAAPSTKSYIEKRGSSLDKTAVSNVDHIMLHFEQGIARAFFQIKDRPDKPSLAYPGAGLPGIVPTLTPFHTLEINLEIDNRKVRFISRRERVLTKNRKQKLVEMPNSLKYVMRHDEILFDPNPKVGKAFHSYLVDEKSIQAAGGIAANNGKIIAIDNMSGHYRPGWRLLAQAVDRLAEVLDNNAVVGVFSDGAPGGGETWFFPVRVFARLAGNGFRADAIEAAIKTSGTWQLPVTADDNFNAYLALSLPGNKSTEEIGKFAEKLQRF
ncbi:MAG: hypothetical protein JMN24_18575 [gamma proteobacterium endosymbiont of Lamellibrachia anaximandri]|nr:hypothetical protein [gamma proteobacterium endosymbiont of Lamellibrachia anaximandri]MBL3619671.1 hypothetical protein [gamma proteobacterium endosymbiont of Lamellibrachia anaximandri]